MTKEKSIAKGTMVKDLVHKLVGEVVDIVPAPADGHHATFYVVRSEDPKLGFKKINGQDVPRTRVSHLIDSQIEVV